MTVMTDSEMARSIAGRVVRKSSGTLTAATTTLFTVTGLVGITGLVGLVKTAITVANSFKLQTNPTVGTTVDLCAATDIGTTDTAAGEILVVTGTRATGLIVGSQGMTASPIYVAAGTIEQVSAGTDGKIDWYLTYFSLEPGAKVN